MQVERPSVAALAEPAAERVAQELAPLRERHRDEFAEQARAAWADVRLGGTLDEHFVHALEGVDRAVVLAFDAPLVVEVVGEDLKVGEVDVFIGRNYVLSARHHAERGFTEVRARCEREPEAAHAIALAPLHLA